MFKISVEEELQVERLLDAEQQAKSQNETDMVYAQHQIEEHFAPPAEETPEDASSDTPEDATDTGDDSTPPPADEDVPAEDEAPSADGAAATESFRSTYIATGDDISMEDLSSVMQTAGSVARGTGSLVARGAVVLKDIGITYGPTVLNGLYRGMVYVMSRLIKVLITGTSKLAHYIDRRINSFTRLQGQIDALKKAASALDTEIQDDGPPRTFTARRSIALLQIRNRIDFTRNLKVASVFMDHMVRDLSGGIDHDIDVIKHIIAYSMSGTVRLPSALLVTPRPTGLKAVTSTMYPVGSDAVESYQYGQDLPGDAVFIVHLPKDDVDDLASAINHSAVFLGLHPDHMHMTSSVPLLSNSELLTYLDALSQLCSACIQHQSIYTSILRKRQTLRLTFRNYFDHIIRAPSKVSVRDSLIDTVALKTVFIDRVYLAGMIDIHDYIARVLAAGIQYGKAHVK
jgi:hypothetical protein